MATITSAGVGSGIDIEGLLSKLMDAERIPVNSLESRRSALGVQISAFGQLKSQMSSMKDLATTLGDSAKFGKFVAASSDEEVFTTTTTSGTIPEEHEINIISLATKHRLTSDPYTDADATVSTGSFSFASGDNSFNVTIDGTNNTLTGLRNAINDSANNTSVNASIINVDGGSRLILTAKDGGTANAITAPGLFAEMTAAVDATFEVDGFLTTSSSNTVSDVIPGISLELTSVGSASLTSSRDMEAIQSTLSSFVSSYNTIRASINTMSEGSLQGDSLPRGFEAKMRANFFAEIDLGDSESMSPYDLGFTFDKEGVLSLDTDQFEETAAENLEVFVTAFTDNNTGFGARIVDSITSYTEADGFIDNRTQGLDTRQSTYADQIERYEYRLEQTEARLRRQFTAMDTSISQLQSGAEYMISQLTQNK